MDELEVLHTTVAETQLAQALAHAAYDAINAVYLQLEERNYAAALRVDNARHAHVTAVVKLNEYRERLKGTN